MSGRGGRRGRWLLAGGALGLAVLAAGVIALFRSTFTTGDQYPEYSTYRSDPRGCRALFEALERTEGLGRVTRNLTPFARLKDTADASVVMAGYTGNWIFGLNLDEADVEALEAIAESGGRLVIGLNPMRFRIVDEAGATAFVPGGDGTDGGGDGEESDESGIIDLQQWWGFRLVKTGEPTDPEGGWPTVGSGEFAGVVGEKTPRWFGALRIDGAGGGWKPVLAAGGATTGGAPDGETVVAVRQFGAGEIVLMTDSFFLSNQGVASAPAVGFIRWVTGGRDRTVFDETHLGSSVDPGISGTVRAYHLQGFFLGLLVLGVLYMWKNASGLVPVDESAEGRRYADRAVRGADATTGFGRLLRRHVPQENLLGTCYRAWFNSRARKPTFDATCADDVIRTIEEEEAKPRRRQDIAAAYNRVAERIQRERRRR